MALWASSLRMGMVSRRAPGRTWEAKASTHPAMLPWVGWGTLLRAEDSWKVS